MNAKHNLILAKLWGGLAVFAAVLVVVMLYCSKWADAAIISGLASSAWACYALNLQVAELKRLVNYYETPIR